MTATWPPPGTPSDDTRLGHDLADLERTDPAVRAAAASLDDAVWRLTRRGVPVTRFRKSTPGRPCEAVRDAPTTHRQELTHP